jgi:hypothetical protein
MATSTTPTSDDVTRAAGPADLALPFALVRELVPDHGTGAAARSRAGKPAATTATPAPAHVPEPKKRAARRRRATVRR